MKRLLSLLTVLCLCLALIAPLSVEAATLTLNKSKATLEVDATLILKLGSLKGTDSKWTTSKKDIVIVSEDGTITAIKEGTATITATYDGTSYKCAVKVVDSNKPTSKQDTPQDIIKTSVSKNSQIKGIKSYDSGQYKVGTDLKQGEYILIANDSSGYFSVTSDSNGRDILFNDNFKINSIVTVKNGEYLTLSRCKAYPASKFYASYTISTDYSGTMLKVGVDIKAGEYKLKADDSDSGYYCIYSDSRHGDIVANDNFSNSSYVTISDGQYLFLSRCKISK